MSRSNIYKKNLKKKNLKNYEGVRYPCDKCEYAATKLSSLKIHVEIKHE